MGHIKEKAILLILIIYLCLKIVFTIANNILLMNIMTPLLFGSMIFYLIWDIKSVYIRTEKNRKLYISMFIISCIHLIIYFCSGFHFGFVKSPYGHNVISILENICIQIIPIISIELARFIVVKRNKNNKSLLFIVTILFTLVEINYSIIGDVILNKEELFKYICSRVLPLFETEFLCTYLTLNASYVLPLIYRISIKLNILPPTLPNTNWFLIGTSSILSPILVYFYFRYEFNKSNNVNNERNLVKKSGFSAVTGLLVIFICFMLGLFRYEPISILSNSMAPFFEKGDVIIYEKIGESELHNIKENTVIVYSIDNISIAHRVVNRIEENGEVYYQTKGDNNDFADTNLVTTTQIKGKYLFKIKYLGFPSIWLYNYLHS